MKFDKSLLTKKNGIIVTVVIAVIVGACLFYYNSERERKEALLVNANSAIDSLYNEQGMLHEQVDETMLLDVKSKIDLVEDDTSKQELSQQLSSIESYLQVAKDVTGLFSEDILRSDVEKEHLDELQVAHDGLDTTLRSALTDKLQVAFVQQEAITSARNGVKTLFDENDNVLSDVERTTYESVVKALTDLPQVDVYEAYQESLRNVLSSIEQREEAARVLEEKRKIAEGNHVLAGVPIINQASLKVYNGCEVASLLMGIQYRGVARDMTLHQIADAVPKSDNPHAGFVSDIYAFAPKNIAHWIAPDALASFGQSIYGNVANITGASPEALKAEIDAGNPVVVYTTDKFLMPSVWDGEIPLTNHVQLLIGYNSYLGTYILIDPVYNQMSIPKAQFEQVYNLNRFAVSIR